MRIAHGAVSLFAETIGDTMIFKRSEDRLGSLERSLLRSVNANPETIAGQMAETKLVAVMDRREDGHPGDMQAHNVFRPAEWYRNGLPGDRPGVLEAGISEVSFIALEGVGQLPEQVVGRQPALLDLQIEMVPCSAGFVQREFVNLEIFRSPTDYAARPREI